MMYNKQSNVLEKFYQDLREMTREEPDEEDQKIGPCQIDTFSGS